MKEFLVKSATRHWPYLTIILVWLSICVTNYTPGTYLTGWDNLHPEFNFGVNIARSVFSAWQEYQGLGLVAGMGHAADLPRQLILFLLSPLLPMSFSRYFFHFAMLLVGTLGMYVLLSKMFLSNTSRFSRIAALGGSLFYLLNLGTIQYFYVPFEPYSTFWGFFPWEIYTLLLFLKHPTRKHFLLVCLINLLAVPQGYVQTIFLVYLICLSVILAIMFFSQRTKEFLKRSVIALFTIFCINAFWLLPNTYFVLTNLSVTQNAMQNKMATEKFFQMNKNHGNIADLAVFKEFYYDFFDYNKETQSFDYLMKPWREHFSSPLVLGVGYVLFGIVLLGFFYRHPYRKILLGLFILTLLIFLSDTLIFSTINSLFRSLPIINQILRNPFTKFIVPAVFVTSMGFGLGIYVLLSYVQQKKSHLITITVLFIFLGICLLSFPTIKGEFFAPQMRVAIPQDYFSLFSYFQTQVRNARIMNLPQGGFWGWNYYSWGARGSGFLWYGIEQPIMDRAFDVWSNDLENYYWELSYALKRRDQTLLSNVLKKYHISYIIFDKNIIFTDGLSSAKAVQIQQELLSTNPHVTQVQQYGNVFVYKTDLADNLSSFVTSTSPLPSILKEEQFSFKDQLLTLHPLYKATEKGEVSDIIYPFESLFTNRFQEEKYFEATKQPNNISLSTTLPPGKYTLSLPSVGHNEPLVPISVQAKWERQILTIQLRKITPTIQLGDRVITQQNDVLQEYTLPLSSQEYTARPILGINNADFFIIPTISATFQEVGKTYLYNNEKVNYVNIYSGKASYQTNLDPEKFAGAKQCGGPTGQHFFSSTTNENKRILEAENIAICDNYQESLPSFSQMLLKMQFSYTSSLDEFPQYCFYSQNRLGCLNKKDVIKTGFSPQKKIVSDYFESSIQPIDPAYLNLILDATADEDKNLRKKIVYEELSLTAYPQIRGFALILPTLPEVKTSYDIITQEHDKLIVALPSFPSSFSVDNPLTKNTYKKTALNYDKNLPGKFSLTEDNEEKSLELTAQNASSYFLYRANNLTAGNAYIAFLKTKNSSHLPLVLNVFTNEQFTNYLYTFTSDKKSFNESSIILPPLYAFDSGISLLLSSNSYNSTETRNSIQEISIHPIPYEFLTAISLQSHKQLVPPIIQFPPAKKHTYTRYSVTPPLSETLILSQVYDMGWKAYIIPLNSQLADAFPFFFGEVLTDHFRVNNWANGWRIPREIRTNEQIVLLFLPQYFEYLGFFLLIFPFLISLRMPKLHR